MVLVPLGNGVYNRDGIIVDYNGKQGHHPKGCNCVKGHINKAAIQINPPLTVTQGVNPLVNQSLTLDPAILQALATNPTALNAYIASVNNAPSIEANPNPVPPVNPIAVPVAINPVAIDPVVQTFVAGQNEYVIPINVTLPKKGMAQITDARMHTEPKFTDGIHDFRFNKGYASRSIVSNGVWELVLRRKA
tara:strand:- start:175 stop:747 length:573 start_codon:yes stop_codon:yes gene_type:complete